LSVSLLCLQSLLTNMNYRTALQVRLPLAEDLACYWCGIAFAKHNILEQIGKGIPLRPVKIDMRNSPRPVAQMQQKGGNGVRHCRTFCPEHSVPVHIHAFNP